MGGYVPAPGKGYSSDMQMPSSYQCFNVSSSYQGPHSGYLGFADAKSLYQVQQQLNVDVDASLGIDQFSASASYANSIKSTDYSDSFNYYELITFLVLTIQPFGGGEDALNKRGENYYRKHFKQFGQACGDKIITQMNMGASLYATVKIHYATKEEKTEYDAKIKAGVKGIGSVSGSVQSAVSKYKLKGSIQVIAYQIGGEPARLANIFKKDPHGGYYATNCDFGDMKACNGVINGIISYAQDDFSKQVSMTNKHPHGNASPTGPYISERIDDLLGLKEPPSYAGKAVKKARKDLAEVLKKYRYYYKGFTRLPLYYPVPLDDTIDTEIDTLANIANQNVNTLTDSDTGAIQCFLDTQHCVDIASNLEAKLTPITAQDVSFLNQMQYRMSMSFADMDAGAYWYPTGTGNNYVALTSDDPNLDYHGTLVIGPTSMKVHLHVYSTADQNVGWVDGTLYNKNGDNTYSGNLTFSINGHKVRVIQQTGVVTPNPYAFPIYSSGVMRK